METWSKVAKVTIVHLLLPHDITLAVVLELVLR